jgi:hypothetical protein
MAGLVPAISFSRCGIADLSGITGTSPVMTNKEPTLLLQRNML